MFDFTHQAADVPTRMVALLTEVNVTLPLSAAHYVYGRESADGVKTVKTVDAFRIREFLIGLDGKSVCVVWIWRCQRVYALHRRLMATVSPMILWSVWCTEPYKPIFGKLKNFPYPMSSIKPLTPLCRVL